MKQGLIYKSGEDLQGVKISEIVRKLKTLAKILSITGGVLICGAGTMLLMVFLPLFKAEINYWKFSNKKEIIAPVLPQKAIEAEVPIWAVPDLTYSIYIPKIEAISKVIADIDPGDPKIYMAALKEGVAEAKGLAHPGEVGTTYLFAHSVGNRIDFARYNAVFYLLDKLEIGESVEIVYKGKLYKYLISEKVITQARDVSFLVPQFEQEKLVLQTCYPPGTAWKRLIIVAKPV